MSNLPRLNRQSAGFAVCQFFDNKDNYGTTYDSTNRPLLSGARYTYMKDADGFLSLQTVVNTSGPIGGWVSWPPKAPRTNAQLAMVFPAKITTASPLKATPVSTGNGSGWTAATDLAEVAVFTSDGSAPSVGTFGIVVVGTELGAQNPLFFQGGAGAGMKTYKITVNSTGGIYTLQEYDRKGGSTVGSAVAGCEELNLAPNVPANHWVFGKTESDGVIRFYAPFGGC